MSTISAVVPMYNEQDRIAATLRALLDQTRPFDQIIVVDNGSTDESVRIVATLSQEHPTIRLLHESEPGCYAARATGYDAVTADIIARTDADTLVDREWAATIVAFFDSEVGQAFSGSSGPISLYDGPPFKIVRRFTHVVSEGRESTTIVGPNHALRRTAWEGIRDDLTRRVDVWEDFDISLALESHGHRMWFNPDQEVATSARTQRKSPLANRHYLFGGIRTAKARDNAKVTRIMRIDLPIRLLLFTGSWLVFRPWDDRSQTWRPHRLSLPLDRQHGDVTVSR